MSCPDCGSPHAVDKRAAWDALKEMPPGSGEELKQLRRIRDVALGIAQERGHPATDYTVVETVPAALLDDLEDLLGVEIERRGEESARLHERHRQITQDGKRSS